jgi:UDP-glucuronate 4-epimerase
MKVLITGCAGFIGYNFSKFLLQKNYKIIGIDCLNSYYSVKLKKDRLNQLLKFKNFKFFKNNLEDLKNTKKIFNTNKFDCVFHLAAQAGVRYSVDFPNKYIESNIIGFFNVLELVKEKRIKKFFYASSSSVYGNSKEFPLKENQILHPTNTYSLTKKFNEDLSEIYNKYYAVKSVGIRFFTVYGEWGRPDMFYSKVLDAAFKNKKLYINNNGHHQRDFTYIQDINEILLKLLKTNKNLPRLINMCSNNPVSILNLVKLVEKYTKKIKFIKRKIQLADVIKTHGDNSLINKFKLINKFTSIEKGIEKTINWYKKYNKLK